MSNSLILYYTYIGIGVAVSFVDHLPVDKILAGFLLSIIADFVQIYGLAKRRKWSRILELIVIGFGFAMIYFLDGYFSLTWNLQGIISIVWSAASLMVFLYFTTEDAKRYLTQ